MALTKLLVCSLSLALLSYGRPAALDVRNYNPPDFKATCDKIAASISNASQVYWPSSSEYSVDIFHADTSSSQESACSVEPGCVEDVSKILCILGSTRTPFAVKCGGHATNPGFSSTKGVQIAMTRFNETKYNSYSGTVEVGAGLTWDKVYATLEPSGVSVVGGRTVGVGVAGFALGGGYSFQTDQYGLTLDNIVGYEVVLPNGTVTSVTPNDDDLYFALRGGMNNFGIVTKFILKAHSQTEVWGGVLYYGRDQLDKIKQALLNFQQKTDVKASLDVSPVYSGGELSFVADIFYDAPTQSGIFDEFLAIPTTNGTVTTRPFPDFISSTAAQASYNGLRVFIDIVPVTDYSCDVIDAFINQTEYWGARVAALDKNATVYTVLEPFPNSYFSHGSGSAWPPDRSLVTFPSLLTFEWSDPSLDDTMASALRQMGDTLRAVAVADGQPVENASHYVNYALYGTPVENIYGDNLGRLREIKAAVDPQDVMGLAGGFKLYD